MSITFEVPGRIAGKGRARSAILYAVAAVEVAKALFEQLTNFTTIDSLKAAVTAALKAKNLMTVYTPSETREAEALVKSFARAAMCGRPPVTGPVWLHVHAVMTPPPSWTKSRRAQTYFVTGKPDADNVLKLIGDSLNEVCWDDDAQFAAIFFVRTYDIDAPEKVTITFGQLDGIHIPIDRPNWAPADLPLFSEART